MGRRMMIDQGDIAAAVDCASLADYAVPWDFQGLSAGAAMYRWGSR